MQSKIITHNGITITVAEASILMALKRDRLRADGAAIEDDDIEHRVLRILLYPNLIACTTEASGIEWPISFEEFLDIPEKLAITWERAAAELNPHWFNQDAEEDKKKVGKIKLSV